MSTRSVKSERSAMEELGTAITALTLNMRGEFVTTEWMTESERRIVEEARRVLQAVRDRVAVQYNLDDPR